MIPENSDTRESYVTRQAEDHLELAKCHHAFGGDATMWIQLLFWAMAEEIYGEHWDNIHRSKK